MEVREDYSRFGLTYQRAGVIDLVFLRFGVLLDLRRSLCRSVSSVGVTEQLLEHGDLIRTHSAVGLPPLCVALTTFPYRPQRGWMDSAEAFDIDL